MDSSTRRNRYNQLLLLLKFLKKYKDIYGWMKMDHCGSIPSHLEDMVSKTISEIDIEMKTVNEELLPLVLEFNPEVLFDKELQIHCVHLSKNTHLGKQVTDNGTD